MSKLFELYVLGLLKDKYGDKILFQAKGSYGNPDYLLIDDMQPLIIDAKYRPTYQQDKNLSYIIEDIRQISGYARDVGILTPVRDKPHCNSLILFTMWLPVPAEACF